MVAVLSVFKTAPQYRECSTFVFEQADDPENSG